MATAAKAAEARAAKAAEARAAKVAKAKAKQEAFIRNMFLKVQAIDAGLPTFTSPRPCMHHGKSPERYISTESCVACCKERAARDRASGATAKRYRLWLRQSPDRAAALAGWYCACQRGAEMPDDFLSPTGKPRLGALIKATKAIYAEARLLTLETGVKHHVDHIKPLALGGLHHPDNLQVLTARENISKGASWVDDQHAKEEAYCALVRAKAEELGITEDEADDLLLMDTDLDSLV